MRRLQEIDDRGAWRPCRLTFANMKTVTKHSINLNDHKTSISLENEFWHGLREIAKQEGTSTAELVAKIDRERNNRNLSSAIRVFVYSHFRAKRL